MNSVVNAALEGCTRGKSLSLAHIYNLIQSWIRATVYFDLWYNGLTAIETLLTIYVRIENKLTPRYIIHMQKLSNCNVLTALRFA